MVLGIGFYVAVAIDLIVHHIWKILLGEVNATMMNRCILHAHNEAVLR
jgi:hypothetical protein